MWTPDAVDGSWHNVYSLLAFQPAVIPYRPLREALGSDPKDNFQGLRLVRDHRVDLVLEVLGIRTITRDWREPGKQCEQTPHPPTFPPAHGVSLSTRHCGTARARQTHPLRVILGYRATRLWRRFTSRSRGLVCHACAPTRVLGSSTSRCAVKKF